MPAKWSQWGSETVAGGGGGGGGGGWGGCFSWLSVLIRLFAGLQLEGFFSQLRGFPYYFWGSRLFPTVFFSPFLQCVCLSTQRLIALAKGKMSMTKMKMGGQENESAQGKQC
ncbi:uncharacterized [Lates japonicus]